MTWSQNIEILSPFLHMTSSRKVKKAKFKPAQASSEREIVKDVREKNKENGKVARVGVKDSCSRQ